MKLTLLTCLFLSIYVQYTSIFTTSQSVVLQPTNIDTRIIEPTYTPESPRIIAIGDIHGDLKAIRILLSTLQLVNETGHWIGGNTIVVQTGDIMDRARGKRVVEDEGNEEVIWNFLEELHLQAKAEGGAIHLLYGNHEIMNVEGHMHYASPENIKSFGGLTTRKQFFRPGGKMAKLMAKRHKLGIIIGKWLFVHAGFTMEWIHTWIDSVKLSTHPLVTEWKLNGGDINKVDLELINNLMSSWLNGDYVNKTNKPNYEPDELIQLIIDSHGPLWQREFGEADNIPSTSDECIDITTSLSYITTSSKISPTHMAIGHTPQFMLDDPKSINSICDRVLWKLDVGMSRAFDIAPKVIAKMPLLQQLIKSISAPVTRSEEDLLRVPAALEIVEDGKIINVIHCHDTTLYTSEKEVGVYVETQ